MLTAKELEEMETEENEQIFKVDLDFRIDKWGWKEQYERMARAVLKEFGFKIDDIVWKRSDRRGFHVWFHTRADKKITPDQCNMTQAFLNDDWGRVIINQYRILRGDDWIKGNKLFSRVLFRKEGIDEKCKRCRKHLLFIKMMKELNNGGEKSVDNKASVQA